jgi:hypothetical protein
MGEREWADINGWRVRRIENGEDVPVECLDAFGNIDPQRTVRWLVPDLDDAAVEGVARAMMGTSVEATATMQALCLALPPAPLRTLNVVVDFSNLAIDVEDEEPGNS